VEVLMSPLIELAACEFLMMSARDRLSGPDADAARRVMDAVGWRWDLKLRELEVAVPPMGEPLGSEEHVPVLVSMGEWELASEAAKSVLGLPDTVRVFIVPESATVSVDFGGGE